MGAVEKCPGFEGGTPLCHADTRDRWFVSGRFAMMRVPVVQIMREPFVRSVVALATGRLAAQE